MRNRFSEIWVPAVNSRDDLLQIVEERWTHAELRGLGTAILDFVDYFRSFKLVKRVFSLRDILAWVSFLNTALNRFVSRRHSAMDSS